MPRKATGDYERVEEALSELKEDIEFEYGKPYKELERKEQRQALLDYFFKGEFRYTQSAEDMREGLAYMEKTGEAKVYIDTIRLKGFEHRIIRDVKTGKIRKWVK